MPRSKQQDLALAERRHLVASLYLQQRTMRQIAKQVGASHGTICNDVNALEAHWRELATEDIRSAKGRQLAKLRVIEREAWQQWEKSKADIERQTTTMETGGADGAKQKATLLKEARLADTRYMETVAWCMEHEAKILGLYAPPPRQNDLPPAGDTPNASPVDYSKLTLDEIALLRELRKRLQERAAQGAATPITDPGVAGAGPQEAGAYSSGPCSSTTKGRAEPFSRSPL
jgi:hypothetical protein